jgi:hypothetical protein
MTGLVVAIAETLPADVPAGTHEGVVVPLGTVPHAFFCKIALLKLIILHEKSHDGDGVFDYALFSDFIGLPLVVLPLSVVPWLGVGVSLGVGFLGDGLIKLAGRVTLRELFSTVSRTLSKQTR